MKLGVFSVMLPELTPEEAAPNIRAAGYDGVEWRVYDIPKKFEKDTPSYWGNNHCTFAPTQAEAERARALTQEAGLATPNIGSYIDLGELDKAEAAIQFAHRLGSPHFRVGFGNFEGNYTQHFEDAKAFLAEVIALSQAAQIKPLVEIHHRSIVASASLMHRLVSNFSPDEVGVIHDAGNMAHEGFEDYRLGLELLGEYLSEVHVKNAAFEPREKGVWQPYSSPLEKGVVDFKALFSALKEVGYDGWLVAEDFSNTLSAKEAIYHNAAFIRAAWEAA